jgi:LPS O-antigen subunit length determinant protein (WzzB/FepE family)
MKDQNRISEEKELRNEDEIDLISLAKTLWVGRRTIFNTVVIFALLGVLLALFSEKEYTASTIMVPQVENQSTQLGGLSSLASLAGVNMDMNAGTNAISPILYPKIMSSVSFQLEIMNAEYLFEESKEPASLLDYYTDIYKPGLFGTIKKYTFGLPGLIIKKTRGEHSVAESDPESGVISISHDQEEVRKIIEEKLSLEVNEQDGYLTLVSRFHQAHLSAQVAQKAQKLLQEYVTQFKIEKATAQLEFIKGRYEENKSDFEEAQSQLAAFRDANKNITSEIMRTHEERLQNEYQLAFEVYSELAKQLEQSMIKVKEDTPVLSIINEVTVPIEKSKPNRVLILIIWIILGGFIGFSVVAGNHYFKVAKVRWKELKTK